MSNLTIFSIAILLLGLGIVLLIAALIPIRKIINRLPKSPLRKRWYLLLSLAILFLLSYLSYGVVFWNQFKDLADLLVPGVFFFGACFVWLISSLSLQTAIDLRRVYRLEEESITDALTGAYNRRYLERRLGEEFSHSKQFDSPLSILLIDVDHFKDVNDTAGHHIGDQVIINLAQRMSSLIRGADILVRFGGDEFIIIALNTSAEAAGKLAEKIVDQLHAKTMRVSGENDSTIDLLVTISIGVAALSPEMADIHQLIHSADKALYCAKREGRNRVIVYPYHCVEK